ncbi:HD-GYP domain-containing protein [Salinibius halmophilus]|uniref:HD-GYP domain-containing protein n=1 Tax=Salinibius halmophilus TaxID=1853216 RepID=UPI000E667A92|nr:HD-GYP domain-containing protein [Salinibius halmophilus]
MPVDHSHSEKRRLYIERTTREVLVEDLEVGMYVCALDRPWLGTKYPLQGFRIQTQKDIAELKRLCRRVQIDEAATRQAASVTHVVPERKEKPTNTITSLRQGEVHHTTASDKPSALARNRSVTSFKQARKIWDDAKDTAVDLSRRVSQGERIDRRELEKSAKSLTQAVIRRPASMMWLSKIKSHDQYTAEHSVSVGILSGLYGRQMRASESDIQLLSMAGLLHDVGKLRIPKSLLHKTSDLSEAELKLVKAHPKMGYQLLVEDPAIPQAVADAALSHHERYDGLGYPYGKVGEEISKIARTIAITDAYDAMTSERPYSSARTHIETLREMHSLAGHQFDPVLLNHFIGFMGLFPAGTVVQLSDNSECIVLHPRRTDPQRPIVMRVRDSDGLPTDAERIDLAEHRRLTILRELRAVETTIDLGTVTRDLLPILNSRSEFDPH